MAFWAPLDLAVQRLLPSAAPASCHGTTVSLPVPSFLALTDRTWQADELEAEMAHQQCEMDALCHQVLALQHELQEELVTLRHQ